MDLFFPRRVPCSVCGRISFQREDWFLVVENRWLDRLKILTWHPALATQKEIRSACCYRHLRLLISHWLDQDSLRLVPHAEPPVPITSSPMLPDIVPDDSRYGRVIGELSVHRESFSRVWTGSPAARESILDALTPGCTESRHDRIEFPIFASSPESTHRVPLH